MAAFPIFAAPRRYRLKNIMRRAASSTPPRFSSIAASGAKMDAVPMAPIIPEARSGGDAGTLRQWLQQRAGRRRRYRASINPRLAGAARIGTSSSADPSLVDFGRAPGLAARREVAGAHREDCCREAAVMRIVTQMTLAAHSSLMPRQPGGCGAPASRMAGEATARRGRLGDSLEARIARPINSSRSRRMASARL